MEQSLQFLMSQVRCLSDGKADSRGQVNRSKSEGQGDEPINSGWTPDLGLLKPHTNP